MHAVLWRDYLCPWCYLGRDRTALLESLGVEVTPRAYELHPEIPSEGKVVRPGGRLSVVLDHIAAECSAVGLPFRPPSKMASTRRALEVSEVVRTIAPAAFGTVDGAFYDAQWVHDLDLGDHAVVDRIVVEAGVDLDAMRTSLATGEGAAALAASMADARDHEVTGAPAWWLDDRLLIPGVQEQATLERWVERLGRPRNEDGAPR